MISDEVWKGLFAPESVAVVGASNKSFIGHLAGAPVGERLPGSLAALITAVGIERAIVRVHEVAATRQFLAIATALKEAAA